MLLWPQNGSTTTLIPARIAWAISHFSGSKQETDSGPREHTPSRGPEISLTLVSARGQRRVAVIPYTLQRFIYMIIQLSPGDYLT